MGLRAEEDRLERLARTANDRLWHSMLHSPSLRTFSATTLKRRYADHREPQGCAYDGGWQGKHALVLPSISSMPASEWSQAYTSSILRYRITQEPSFQALPSLARSTKVHKSVTALE